jgi:hypothetical protein
MTIVDSKIVIAVDAETRSAQRNMELLRAQQQHFAAEVIKGLEGQNKKLEESISKWAKIGAGIASLAGAYAIAKAGIEEYHKAVELNQATQGVNIEKLQQAARGLKTTFELQTFAAKTNAGAFKLTNEQMQLAIKAMEVYEDRGFDAAKVTDAITDALIKADTKGLRSFGIQIFENGTKAEKFRAIIKALTKDVEEAGAATDAGADAWQRQGVTFADAMSRIKQSIGEIVIALTPLVELAARLVKHVAEGLGDNMSQADAARAQLANNEESILRSGDKGWEYRHRDSLRQAGYADAFTRPLGYAALTEAERGRMGLGLGVGFSGFTRGALAGAFGAEARRQNEIVAQEIALLQLEAEERAAKRRGGGRAAGDGTFADAIAGDDMARGLEWGGQFGAIGRVTGAGGGFGVDLRGILRGTDPSLLDAEGRYGAFSHGRSQSRLAEMFGPIEEFNAYARGFEMLGGAMTSALDAWITGSMGAAAAFKQFIAESMRGLALEMAVQAIRHGAFALGSLAFGDVKGAATHGIAAAKFGAGALAAGIAAKALGAGGNGASSGAGAAAGPGSGAPAAGAGGGAPTTIIIATGNDFSEDSPRARTHKARQLVRTAQAQAGRGGSFS